jgi:hypothetical protein
MIPISVLFAVARTYAAGLILRRFAVLLVGLILVLVGIVSLYLSYAVAQGWWQGTSQAFGVGFVVGGLVDVLAIAGLDSITQTSRQRDRRIAEAVARAIAPKEQNTTTEGNSDLPGPRIEGESSH